MRGVSIKWNPEPTYPPDSANSFWYDPDSNCFSDEDGTIIHNFSGKFDVWQLDEWKKTRDYGTMVDRHGELCEFFYLKNDLYWSPNYRYEISMSK